MKKSRGLELALQQRLRKDDARCRIPTHGLTSLKEYASRIRQGFSVRGCVPPDASVVAGCKHVAFSSVTPSLHRADVFQPASPPMPFRRNSRCFQRSGRSGFLARTMMRAWNRTALGIRTSAMSKVARSRWAGGGHASGACAVAAPELAHWLFSRTDRRRAPPWRAR